MAKPSRCDCGAVFEERLDWCPRCYTRRAVATGQEDLAHDDSGERVPERPTSPISPRRPASTQGKWDATDITFALPGRIIATILFTVPLLWFLYYLVPFGFVGVIAYCAFYPRGLRQIWTRADRL